MEKRNNEPNRQSLMLPLSLTESLEAWGRSREIPLSVILLATYQILLGRYSTEKDIEVEIRRKNGKETGASWRLHGDLSGNPSFRELLSQVAQTIQKVKPLKRVFFTKTIAKEKSNLFAEDLILCGKTALPDWSLSFQGTKAGLTVFMECDHDPSWMEMPERAIRHFQNLLEGLAVHSDLPIADLPLLTPDEKRQILVEWNETHKEYPRDKCIHELFEKQVEKAPDAVAVLFEEQQVTYRELNRRANQLAHYLQSQGIGPEILVGICLERSLEMVIALLSVLKAGGAYVPLDPRYPQERLAFMLEDSKAQILLTHSSLCSRFTFHVSPFTSQSPVTSHQSSTQSPVISHQSSVSDLSSSAFNLQPSAFDRSSPFTIHHSPFKIIYLDTEQKSIAEQCFDNPLSEVKSENLAYAIYTSGSTGKPKGVLVTHRGLPNVVEAQVRMFGLSSDERVLQFASLNFDASVFDLGMALGVGGTLCLAKAEALLPGPGLNGLLDRLQITIMTITPSALARLPVTPLLGMRIINVAGEACPRALIAHWSKEHRFFNLYGPTEATIWATAIECFNADPLPLIGRPIANTRVYILDESYHPLPIGMPGELYIGGDGLVRGYLGRPDLTAEKFIPDPFSAAPDARLYRTGDLARYLADGNIEFLGRIDHQVKIRGFRIELGEIETVLTRHDQVREAIVLAREDSPGDKRLTAYVVLNDKERPPEIADLRAHLMGNLPDYMVPSAFIVLDSLPLTPNGKVDRKALPLPEYRAGMKTYVASRTPVEETLAKIFSEVLGIERIGIHDNFFEMGGHSLLAAQIIVRLQETLQTDLSMSRLFSAPTIAALAEQIAGPGPAKASYPPIIPLIHKDPPPLSFDQERIWFLDQFEPDNPAYNVSFRVRMRGPLDAIVFKRAAQEIVARHEALRTSFTLSGDKPIQVIAPTLTLTVPVIDLSALARSEQEIRVEQFTREDNRQTFKLSQGPLLRLTLLRLGTEEHVMLFSLQHIISDGGSVNIFLEELTVLYRAFLEGRSSPLAALPVQFKDFSVWQRSWLQSGILRAQLAYWQKQLHKELPVLEFPTDYPRPAVKTYNADLLIMDLAASLGQDLRDLSRKQGCTLFMALLAAFKILLFRYTGQTDILVGTPINSRHFKEVEKLIGMFLNNLVLRTDLSGDPSYLDVLRKVRKTTLEAYENQDAPFERVVQAVQPERDLSRTPLFQVFFNMFRLPPEEADLSGLRFTDMQTTDLSCLFDFTLYVIEQSRQIRLRLVYNTDLFKREHMLEMLEQFLFLLRQIVEDPGKKITQYSLVTLRVKEILPDPTAVLAEPQYMLVDQAVVARAAAMPQQIAVCQGRQHWTYAALVDRARMIAAILRSQGLQSGDVAAVCGSRSFGLTAGMLGVFFSGGVLLTLDPGLPVQRRQLMLQEAGARYFLDIRSEEQKNELLDASDLKTVIGIDPENAKVLSHPRPPHEIPLPDLLPNQSAYLFFTSGTTGIPKGVLGCHKGLAHFLHWQRTEFGIGPHDRFAQLTALSFDVVLRDIFTPLTSGATLCLPEKEDYDPAFVLPWMESESVTALHTVPALIQTWSANALAPVSLQHLRLIFSAGEPLQGTLVQRWYRNFPQSGEMVNLYGPTETTLAKCFYRVPRETGLGMQPLGRPLPETQVLVLGDEDHLCGIGEPGEIVIRTPFRSLGYRQAVQEQKRFTKNPFRDDEKDIVYRSGDRGCYQPDGMVEFLGRIDNQIKIRGIRIEPGEIETHLLAHPAVREAVVHAYENEQCTGQKRLAAYIIAERDQSPSPKELSGFLRSRLPEYMIPAAFVQLQRFPLTGTGKVDRRALPAPDGTRPELEKSYVAPRTSQEEILAKIWAEVLEIEKTGIHDNFFELGGHSLLAIQLMARVRDAFKIDIPLQKLFMAPTVNAMAAVIEEQKQNDREEIVLAALPVIIPSQAQCYEPFPLTDVQQAYWIGRSGAFELGNVSTHNYTEYEMRGLDLERYEAAWQKVIERHGMLRAIFLADGRQRILEKVPAYRIEILDLRRAAPEVVSAELEKIRDRLSHQVLPADRWPLFEIRATFLEDDLVRLHISRDALIRDAWSGTIIERELDQLYRNPQAVLPPLELSFRDYVLAEEELRKSPIYEKALAYWRGRLKTLAPAPELPLVQNPGSLKQQHFVRCFGKMEPGRWQKLKARAAQSGLTSSVVLLTAFSEVLAMWSKNPRFTINLTLFNRLPLHPQVNDIVGDFTSLALLEADLSGTEPFEERAKRLQAQFWEDLGHRYVSGVRVMRELLQMQGGTPHALMPVVFTSGLVHGRAAQATVKRETEVGISRLLEPVYSISQTPQVWLDHQVGEKEGMLIFAWDAVAELFPTGLVDEMFKSYCGLLERLADEENTWQARSDRLVGLPATQIEQRREVNATQGAISPDSLQTLFMKQALPRGKQAAVITSGRTVTYEELFQLSNRIGHWLKDKGVKPNTLVAVVMEKGWEQAAAVLGILNSGAAYLPIDPDLPKERIQYLLKQGEVQYSLTQPWLEEKIEWPEGIKHLSIRPEGLQDLSSEPLTPIQAPTDLAYVIFTSGSTGEPKGVMIDHQGAVNTILDINERFGVKPEDRVLGLSALNFDLSVYDIFGILAAGATLVLPDADKGKDPGHWLEMMKKHQVSLWNTVPALMEMLVEYVKGGSEPLPESLRLVFMSGDWIPLNLPERIKSKSTPGTKIYSGGGATEASIWSISYPITEVDPSWTSIPYGKPLRNQSFQVLDEQLRPKPVWVSGDLYIGGIGLAQGYWKDEAKTKKSFIIHPRTGERLYRTGDQGRYLPDGNIEFLGRKDTQVKIQGYRIELGEIESVLLQHPGVKGGVVAALGDPHGDKRLIGYIVPNQPQDTPITTSMDYQPQKNEGLILDPVERFKFKMAHPGLRKENGDRSQFQFGKPELDKTLLKKYTARRSYRKFGSETMPAEQLGRLLSSLRQVQLEGIPLPKSQYGSAGSLYPVQVYLYTKPERIQDLEGGTYYYHPQEHRLTRLSPEVKLERDLYTISNQEIFSGAAFCIFLVAEMEAIVPMYGEWSRDFCLLEAGLMTQLLETSAVEQGIGLCQIGGFNFEPIRRHFHLEPHHLYLHQLIGGPIAEKRTGLEALAEDTNDLRLLLDLLEEKAGGNEDGKDRAVKSRTTNTKQQAELPDDLKRFMRGKLPEYMVPTQFIMLQALPLTQNGKVDRKSLPRPDAVQSIQVKTFVAPQNALQSGIAAIWQEVLKKETIGIHDNFFDLGGNSIYLIQVHRRLQEKITTDIPIIKMFENPTISALSQYIGQGRENLPAIEQSEEWSMVRRTMRQKRRQIQQQKLIQKGKNTNE